MDRDRIENPTSCPIGPGTVFFYRLKHDTQIRCMGVIHRHSSLLQRTWKLLLSPPPSLSHYTAPVTALVKTQGGIHSSRRLKP